MIPKYNILEFLPYIPKGKVMSYSALAKVFGIENGQRAVAQILHQNKYLDKYPCYKIINADGSLGGYVKGEKEKMKLLKAEGIYFKGGEVLNPGIYFWEPKLYNVFIAIEIDEVSKLVFKNVQNNILQEFTDIDKILNFQSVETAHQTIYFCGDSYDMSYLLEKYKTFNQCLYFNLHYNKIDLFGRKKNRKVVYFGIEEVSQVDKLTKLYNQIRDHFGFKELNYPEFIPHITIARVKSTSGFDEVEDKLIRLLNQYELFLSKFNINIYCSFEEVKQFRIISMQG